MKYIIFKCINYLMNINTLINRKNTYSNISIDTDINYDYNILKYLEDKLNNIIKYNKNINKLNTEIKKIKDFFYY